MTYFKTVSVLLGAGMVAGGLASIFFTEGLRSLTPKFYPENRPVWVPVTGLLMLFWTLGTWFAFLKNASMENFVVTLVVSLGLLKIAPVVFFYRKSREVILALVAETLAFRTVALCSGSVGAGLLVMGIFF